MSTLGSHALAGQSNLSSLPFSQNNAWFKRTASFPFQTKQTNQYAYTLWTALRKPTHAKWDGFMLQGSSEKMLGKSTLECPGVSTVSWCAATTGGRKQVEHLPLQSILYPTLQRKVRKSWVSSLTTWDVVLWQKMPDRNNLREKGFVWLSVLEWDCLSWPRRHGNSQGRPGGEQEAESRQEVGLSFTTSRSSPSDLLPQQDLEVLQLSQIVPPAEGKVPKHMSPWRIFHTEITPPYTPITPPYTPLLGPMSPWGGYSRSNHTTVHTNHTSIHTTTLCPTPMGGYSHSNHTTVHTNHYSKSHPYPGIYVYKGS